MAHLHTKGLLPSPPPFWSSPRPEATFRWMLLLCVCCFASASCLSRTPSPSSYSEHRKAAPFWVEGWGGEEPPQVICRRAEETTKISPSFPPSFLPGYVSDAVYGCRKKRRVRSRRRRKKEGPIWAIVT